MRAMSRGLTRELAAEFLGTFMLIAFGVGVVAQVVLSANANGSYLSINLGWGLGVMLGVLVAGGVSGAHLNPAVTVALAVHRGLPWGKVLPYVVAQTAGAFLASAVVFLTYHDAFAAFDQIVGTALLVIGVFAIGDPKNVAAPSWMGPLLVGLLVVAIGVAFGFNAGYAINPARDFGPRLFTAVAGWGGGVFTAGNGWWWVPVVGPIIGAIGGGALYDLCITRRHPAGSAR
jgi:aquaporin-9